MTSSAAFIQATEKFAYWMQTYALPLWYQQGIEASSGACAECMNEDGLAAFSLDRRTRVQARQMFTFAAAYQQGWCPQGREVVEGIQRYLDTYAQHPTYPGAYIFKLDAAHQVVDDSLDTYDCAFFLLAWAYQFSVFGDMQAKVRAEQLLSLLDKQFKGKPAGWLEGSQGGTRRQNPHMHLFEAFLAWYEASKDAKWLARAAEIFSLFELCFFDHRHGVLYEYFQQDLRPLSFAEGQAVEPGHHMEWVWLLRRYQQFTGAPVDEYCRVLYARGLQFGLDSNGLLYDEVDNLGRVSKGSKRLWTVTELIKAHLAQARHGWPGAEQAAAEAIDALFKQHLCSAVPGFYIERLNDNNQPVAQQAPATSMYHLMMACLEACHYRQELLV